MMRIVLVLLAVGAFAVFNAAFIVDQREQVLVLEFGKSVGDPVTTPGLHWKVPFVQTLVRYDNRILDLNAQPTEVIDSDKKPLRVDAFIKYHISNPLKFYQAVQTESRANQRLNTFLDSSLREIMGGVPIRTLLTDKRVEVMERIREDMVENAKSLGVEVVDVRIMRADFPQDNTNRIYENMTNERLKEAKELRAKGAEKAQQIMAEAEKQRTILLAEAEKESQIIRGEGDAEASRIFASAFGRDPEFYDFYRSMEVYRRTVGKDDTTMVLSPSSEFMRFFGNIDGATK